MVFVMTHCASFKEQMVDVVLFFIVKLVFYSVLQSTLKKKVLITNSLFVMGSRNCLVECFKITCFQLLIIIIIIIIVNTTSFE